MSTLWVMSSFAQMICMSNGIAQKTVSLTELLSYAIITTYEHSISCVIVHVNDFAWTMT